MADQRFPLDAAEPSGEVPVVFDEEEYETYPQDGGQEADNSAQVEDRSAEQQLIDSASDWFGLNGARNGAGLAPQQQAKDGLPALMLRSLISAPFYPIKLVQVCVRLCVWTVIIAPLLVCLLKRHVYIDHTPFSNTIPPGSHPARLRAHAP